MRRVVRAAALLCALVGCGSGAKGPDAAAGNGGGGAGGSAGSGSAGTGGASGSVGTGTGGAGGDGSGLPACAITTRPQDPTTGTGGAGDAGTGSCNSIVLDEPSINRGCYDQSDGGVSGGPTGGAIRDGDYDIVSADSVLSGQPCTPGYSSGMTRRRIRVFGGGTYIEWAYSNISSSGSDPTLSYDTTVRAAGHTLTFVSFDCSSSFGVTSYGYTAGSDDFTYFAYAGGGDGAGDLQTVVRYRRACWR